MEDKPYGWAIAFEGFEERSWTASTRSLSGKGFVKTISNSLKDHFSKVNWI
jgi:hypothetical protein